MGDLPDMVLPLNNHPYHPSLLDYNHHELSQNSRF
jgi:hypothetical protein